MNSFSADVLTGRDLIEFKESKISKHQSWTRIAMAENVTSPLPHIAEEPVVGELADWRQ